MESTPKINNSWRIWMDMKITQCRFHLEDSGSAFSPSLTWVTEKKKKSLKKIPVSFVSLQNVKHLTHTQKQQSKASSNSNHLSNPLHLHTTSAFPLSLSLLQRLYQTVVLSSITTIVPGIYKLLLASIIMLLWVQIRNSERKKVTWSSFIKQQNPTHTHTAGAGVCVTKADRLEIISALF